MDKSFKEQTWIKRDKYRLRVSWESDNMDFTKSCWIRLKFVSKRGPYPIQTQNKRNKNWEVKFCLWNVGNAG